MKEFEFKENLKALRAEAGLSQQGLASALKISQSAVAKWELGKTEPTASMLGLLADYFHVSVDYLLGRE